MVPQPAQIPFGERLESVLQEMGAPWNWALLSRRSGVPESTISRVRRGERAATAEVIELLATTVGMSAAQLAQGTDAESRVVASEQLVRREQYDCLLRALVDAEGKARDAEYQHSRWREQVDVERARYNRALADAETASADAKRLTIELEDARRESDALRQEVLVHRDALQRAVQQVSALRDQLRTMAQELQSAHRTGKVAAILAGIAALPVIATAAEFFRGDSDEVVEDRDSRQRTASSRHDGTPNPKHPRSSRGTR